LVYTGEEYGPVLRKGIRRHLKQYTTNISTEMDGPFEKEIKEKKLELIEDLIEQLDPRKKGVIFLPDNLIVL
jgi:hypothetical protein